MDLGIYDRIFSLVLIIILFQTQCVKLAAQPTIISRTSWGARRSTAQGRLAVPLEYAFIHHTEGRQPSPTDDAGNVATVKGIQNYHMDTKGWGDIGYSFLIGTNGRIYEGRGWSNVGAHTLSYNSRGYGIAFLGSYQNSLPTTAALDAAKALIKYAVSEGYLRPNYKLRGHRQMGSTDCPGTRLFNLIRTWPGSDR